MASFTDYSTLIADIQSWMHRADIAAQIPNFIWLAEARLGRKLSLLDWESQLTLLTTDDIATLPPDYKQPRAVTYQDKPLSYRTPSQFVEEINPNAQSGTPYLYTLLGSDSLKVGPTVDDGTEIGLEYVARLVHLSETNTNNWLLTNHPDLLLFGSLEAANSYIKNEKEELKWAAKFSGGIEELEVENAFSQIGGTPLVIRSA